MPTRRTKLAATTPQLTIGIGELIGASWRGFRAHLRDLLPPSILTLGTYTVAVLLVPSIENPWLSFGAAVLSLVVATAVAYPWFLASLRAVDDDPSIPFEPIRFFDQTVAALYFWGGVLFGLRYLFGLPAVVIALFYAFFGYAVADRKRRRALRSLGWSVHVGQGNRFRLFIIGVVMGFINLFAVSSIGAGVNVLTIAVAVLLILISANVSMVAGAILYRALEEGAGS